MVRLVIERWICRVPRGRSRAQKRRGRAHCPAREMTRTPGLPVPPDPPAKKSSHHITPACQPPLSPSLSRHRHPPPPLLDPTKPINHAESAGTKAGQTTAGDRAEISHRPLARHKPALSPPPPPAPWLPSPPQPPLAAPPCEGMGQSKRTETHLGRQRGRVQRASAPTRQPLENECHTHHRNQPTVNEHTTPPSAV